MIVVFRVDASVRIGIGHLIRCQTLAETLRGRGVEVRFICREYPGNLNTQLHKNGFQVTVLAARGLKDLSTVDDYSVDFGVTQSEDAEQTVDALNGERPDWLVVDHYGLDIEWEQSLRLHANKIMVIDDLANRKHDCDVLLDQNFSLLGKARYIDLVPNSCLQLFGSCYALLRPEYLAYRKTMPFRNGQVNRVLIFFGGSDLQNMTGMALEALSHPNMKHLEVDVVVGVNNPNKKALEEQARVRMKTKIYGPRIHLADLMSSADLAIGAGGTTSWERMCLGLPTVVVSLANNQRPASEALAQAQLIIYAGNFDEIKVEHLVGLLQDLILRDARVAELAMLNQLTVDGMGALRLAEIMNPSRTREFRLRPTVEDDVVFYYNCAVKAITTWAAHRAWFTSKLHDKNSRLFVFEVNGLPIGQIRFYKGGDEISIDYSLDSIVEKQNLAAQLVEMGAILMRRIQPIQLRAEKRGGEEISSLAFLRMQFTENLTNVVKGKVFSIVILSDQASWMNKYIRELVFGWLTDGHRILWVHEKKDLRPADFCFYLSCGQLVSSSILAQYMHNLVVHESDLPRGKGWSPLTWQILEGKRKVPATLFEATEKVDSGIIYAQEWMEFEGYELVDELRESQGRATIKLCRRFVDEYPQIVETSHEQTGIESFYARRREADSELDPVKSIEAQFNLLRVSDNQKYPVFFHLKGHRYVIRIEREGATFDRM